MKNKDKVFEIAYYLVSKLQNKNIKPTALQIIKLVYISFGMHGSKTDSYLFKNDIQAWKFGPVIPELYHKIKNDNMGSLENTTTKTLSKIEIDSLDEVLEVYGNDESFQLVDKTHRDGSPWANYYKENERGTRIDKNEIIKHYKNINNVKDLITKNKKIFISLANQ